MPPRAGYGPARASDQAGPSSDEEPKKPASVKCRSLSSLFGWSQPAAGADEVVDVRVAKRTRGRPCKEPEPQAAALVVANNAAGEGGAEANAANGTEAGIAAEMPAEQQPVEPDAPADAQDDQPAPKKRREASNPMAPWRKYFKPAKDMKNKKGEFVKAVHCELCQTTMIDNADTCKKHTGYEGRDEDGLPKYNTSNKHFKRAQQHELELQRLNAGAFVNRLD